MDSIDCVDVRIYPLCLARCLGLDVGLPTLLCRAKQGIVGTTPWYALAYMTLYLQLVGMSDLQASSLMATFLAASATGKAPTHRCWP